MSQNTRIEWCDSSFSPWIGCTKVSPGCAHCYAENITRARVLRAHGHETWGRGAKRSRTSEGNWKAPLKWNKDALEFSYECDRCIRRFSNPELLGQPWSCPHCGKALLSRRRKVFPSLCDWLDDEVPIEWLADFLRLIHETPKLDWLLLTKRPQNWQVRIREAELHLVNGPREDSDPRVGTSIWLNKWRHAEGSPPIWFPNID